MYRKDKRVVKGGLERKMSRKLSKEEKKSLGREIEFGEFVKVVKKMKKGKTLE
jgi:hypothetical protein